MNFKNFLAIFLAVFLGNILAFSANEYWHTIQTQKSQELEAKKQAELQKARDEQGAKIRQLLLNAHRNQPTNIENDDPVPLNQGSNPSQ